MMKHIGVKLIGEAEHFPFEQRIFNFGILLGMLMTFVGTVMDVHDRYPWVNLLIDFGFLAVWALTYYLTRLRGYFKVVSALAFTALVFVFFPYTWITSGGSAGPVPYFAILFIAVISIILAGRLRVIMALSLLTVELLLIWAENYDIKILKAIESQKLSPSRFAFLIYLSVVMAVMAVLIIVYSNTYMKEKARGERYARTIEEQYRQQSYYMENLEQLIYKLKAERHDFNHHLGVIYGLLEGRESGKVLDYTSKLVSAAAEYQNLVNIPYPIVRAMLNYKLSSAREEGIPLRLDVNLPGELNLNEFDLTVILGNLLDNAMEACAALEEAGRYLDLSIRYQPDYLVLRVENPVGERPSLPEGNSRSTKKDTENHGFGLQNIEYLVNKHHGLLKIEREDGAFKVDIALLTEG